jgi:hypothetical protein
LKKLYKFWFIILVINLNASNIIENKGVTENNERGFAYYENVKDSKDNINNIEPNNKNNQEILILLRKILETNIEIRDILKNEYDPKEKIITNKNGEKCIVNSSADCFEMPITAEAKRTPVYKEWLEKGDLMSSLNKKQWEAKYFNEISKRAYMDMAAMTQFGSDAYPVNYNTYTHNNTTGYATTILRDKIEKSVIEKNLDKVNFIYFIGINKDLDLYAMDNIVRFLKQYENKIKLQFIFQDEQSKKSFEIAHKHNPEFLILNNYKMSVLPNEFKDFNIYTTPSLVAINKEKKSGQTIITGRVSENQANKMIVMYLRSQEIIQDVELNPNNGWKDESNFGEQYIKEYLGEDYIKEMKK